MYSANRGVGYSNRLNTPPSVSASASARLVDKPRSGSKPLLYCTSHLSHPRKRTYPAPDTITRRSSLVRQLPHPDRRRHSIAMLTW
jgi:hypothetical protein